jgi:putative protease
MIKEKDSLVILSPVDRLEEVDLLIDAGADELYAGVAPDSWTGELVSPNQRTFASAQFSSEARLAESVEAAGARSVPLHLTLNAPTYTPEIYNELTSLAQRAHSWGVESFIVGDPGLIARLHELDSSLKITLSTMAGTMNRGWLDYYRTLGLYRAVFPRHLNLAEMASLVRNGGGLEFEAFVLIGKCPNEEAFCSFQHVSPTKRWPCEIEYRLCEEGPASSACSASFVHPVSPVLTDNASASGALSDIALDGGASTHSLALWNRRWSRVERRFGCGLCALDELKKIGVKVAKLVGRGGPTGGKVANVKLVRRFLAGGVDREEARAAYAERFGTRCTPEVCYFPELAG